MVLVVLQATVVNQVQQDLKVYLVTQVVTDK